MKRTIILAISFVCFLANDVFSQQPYRSLKQSGNDTAKYLKYNFKERGDNHLYQGKTFAQLLSELEIKPIGVWPIGADYEDGSSKITGIEVFFTRYNGNTVKYLKDEYLQIIWEIPILYSNSATRTNSKVSPPVKGLKKYESGSEFFTAYPPGDWIPQFYDFFKDQKIKKIYYSPARD